MKNDKTAQKIHALDLYLAGTDVQEIARDNGISVPTAYRWIAAAREHIQARQEQAIDDRRSLAAARYTATLQAFWEPMKAGDHRAARIVMDATQRIVELDGLAAPIRTTSTVELDARPAPEPPLPPMTDEQFLSLAESLGIKF